MRPLDPGHAHYFGSTRDPPHNRCREAPYIRQASSPQCLQKPARLHVNPDPCNGGLLRLGLRHGGLHVLDVLSYFAGLAMEMRKAAGRMLCPTLPPPHFIF